MSSAALKIPGCPCCGGTHGDCNCRPDVTGATGTLTISRDVACICNDKDGGFTGPVTTPFEYAVMSIYCPGTGSCFYGQTVQGPAANGVFCQTTVVITLGDCTENGDGTVTFEGYVHVTYYSGCDFGYSYLLDEITWTGDITFDPCDLPVEIEFAGEDFTVTFDA